MSYQLKCGCVGYNNGVDFCPLHAQAPAVREALERIKEYLGTWDHYDEYQHRVWSVAVFNEVRAVLKTAQP